jgi:hypothetical protein
MHHRYADNPNLKRSEPTVSFHAIDYLIIGNLPLQRLELRFYQLAKRLHSSMLSAPHAHEQFINRHSPSATEGILSPDGRT